MKTSRAKKSRGFRGDELHRPVTYAPISEFDKQFFLEPNWLVVVN